MTWSLSAWRRWTRKVAGIAIIAAGPAMRFRIRSFCRIVTEIKVWHTNINSEKDQIRLQKVMVIYIVIVVHRNRSKGRY